MKRANFADQSRAQTNVEGWKAFICSTSKHPLKFRNRELLLVMYICLCFLLSMERADLSDALPPGFQKGWKGGRVEGWKAFICSTSKHPLKFRNRELLLVMYICLCFLLSMERADLSDALPPGFQKGWKGGRVEGWKAFICSTSKHPLKFRNRELLLVMYICLCFLLSMERADFSDALPPGFQKGWKGGRVEFVTAAEYQASPPRPRCKRGWKGGRVEGWKGGSL